MKPRPFLALYSVVTGLAIAGDLLHNRLLHYGFKPLIMLLLIGWVWQRRTEWQGIGAPTNRSIRWLLIGMGFAWLGDVLLMIRGIDLFALGLAAFLVMQVCYCIAFWVEIKTAGQEILGMRLVVRALPFLIYAGFFLAFIKEPFKQTPSTDGLWTPVVVYVFCLCTMAVMAAMRRSVVDEDNHWRVYIGAILFMLSDSGIAVAKFVQPFPFSAFGILATYAAAQYLIVTGVVSRVRSVKVTLRATTQ